MKRAVLLVLLVVVAAHGLGAGKPALAQPLNTLAGAVDDEGISSVHFALASIPANVSCVRLSGQLGTRTVEVKASVTPGASAQVTFAGLRPGAWVLDLEAFTQTCANVAATTLPIWASASVTTTLGPGQNDLGFTLRPVADVKGSLDFISLILTGPSSFGPVLPGTSQSQNFTIKNVGKATSQITVTVTGGITNMFTATAPCLTLPANGTCTGAVTFQALLTGGWFAQLVVTGSPGGTATVPLSGVVMPFPFP